MYCPTRRLQMAWLSPSNNVAMGNAFLRKLTYRMLWVLGLLVVTALTDGKQARNIRGTTQLGRLCRFVTIYFNVSFCRATLCRRAVSVCPSVCLFVTFVYSLKTNERIFKIFSSSSIQTTLVFPYQTSWQYSNGDLSNRDVECRCMG